jgi:hypothetical protein
MIPLPTETMGQSCPEGKNNSHRLLTIDFLGSRVRQNAGLPGPAEYSPKT